LHEQRQRDLFVNENNGAYYALREFVLGKIEQILSLKGQAEKVRLQYSDEGP